MAQGDRALTQSAGAMRREAPSGVLLWLPVAIAVVSAVPLAGTLIVRLVDNEALGRRALGVAVGVLCSAGIATLWHRALRRRDRPRPDRRREDYVEPAELPPVVAAFVGRKRELEQIVSVLAAHVGPDPAVVLIHGPDGIGKTSLAVLAARQIADRYPGGSLFINFSRRPWHANDSGPDLTNEQLLEAAFTSGVLALRGPGEQLPPTPQARRAFYHERARQDGKSGGRRLIIILDEVDDAHLVNELLPAHSGSAVIVTGRELLTGIRCPYREIELRPLGAPESLELLRELVDGRYGSRVTGEPEHAEAIVARTEGHPLAIHLVGTSLALRPHVPLDTLQQLHREPPLSSESPAESYAMHLSYALLAEEEQAALRLTALLDRPGFPAWKLAALLAADEREAARIVDRLVLAGLLIQTSNDSVGLAVFRVEDQVRRFAQARLDESVSGGEQEQLRARLAEQGRRRRSGRPTGALKELVYAPLAAGRLAEAQAGARKAVELARDQRDAGAELLALAALAEVRAELGSFSAAEDLANQVLAAPGVTDLSRARAGRCLGRIHRLQRRSYEAEDCLLEAGKAASRAADESEVIRIVTELAAAQARHNVFAATKTVEEADELCRDHASGTLTYRAGVQWVISVTHQARGRLPEALACLADGERAALLLDQRVMLAWLTLRRAQVQVARKEFQEATTAAADALELFAGMRHRYGKAQARLTLGIAYTRRDEWALATPMLEEALENFVNCGDRWSEAFTAWRLSQVYRRQSRRDDARELLEAAIATFGKLGDQRSRAAAAADQQEFAKEDVFVAATSDAGRPRT